MNFRDKHVFLIGDTDKFFYLFADALVHRCHVQADSIIAVVYNTGRVETLDRKEPFTYINFEDCDYNELVLSKSFIPISLNSYNAICIKNLIQIDKNFLNKIYVFITDDEVDRWSLIKRKKGRFVVNESMFVSEEVIYMSKMIKHFIVTKAYFKDKIENILERNDLKYVDASVIFDILPCHKSENLKKAIFTRRDDNIIRVMIGTKGSTLKGALKVIHAFRLKKNIQFIIFNMPEKKRLYLNLYALVTRIIFWKKNSYSAITISATYSI